MENTPHMVEQVIKYSDGTETVISYRGKIIDGVLIPDKPEVREKVEEKQEVVEEVEVVASVQPKKK